MRRTATRRATDAGGHANDSARLAEALAHERHVTLELQRAILPLHEGPFDLPGLRAVVRYLPASRDSRVGGDWYITADPAVAGGGQVTDDGAQPGQVERALMQGQDRALQLQRDVPLVG